MSQSQVEFFTRKKDGDAYWRVVDGDGNEVNRSSEGFSQLGGAKNNLLIFHTLLSTDLLSFANYPVALPQLTPLSHLEFYEDGEGQIRWRVTAGNNEIVGAAHKGFPDIGEAKNNVLMTYSLISTYVAYVAMGK